METEEKKDAAEQDAAAGAKPQQADKTEADVVAAIEHSPALRNAVHAGFFFVFAIPLGTLADPERGHPHGRWWAAGFLLFIAFFNLLILRRIKHGQRLARPDEGLVNGLWLYPLALSCCYLILPSYAATGAWAVMAAGDAAASIAGRAISFPKLPWNAKKTWPGVAAFVLASIPICFVALYFVPCPLFIVHATNRPEIPYVWTLAVIASVCGAIVESLPVELDDNVRVPLISGGALWLFAIFLSWGTRDLPKNTFVQPEILLTALAVNGALAIGVLLFKFADLPGTLLGAMLGTIIYFFAQWQGYLLFLLFVMGGSLLSKAGLAYKQRIGAAETNEGKRGIANVAANLLIPGLCCLAYPYGGSGALLMAFAGSLAAAFADTASSEVGALSRKLPCLITTMKPVPHGTNGAVSLLGTLAALGACAAIAGLAWGTDFYARVLVAETPTPNRTRALAGAVLIAAGMLGTLVDSLLGATVEGRIPGIGKGVVNFACTLTGAVVAGLLCQLTLLQ
jgi:uncharacterized protein (TIGR00297 family)